MNTAFAFALADSGIGTQSGSTDDLNAALYSILTAVGNLDATSPPTAPAAMYAFVLTRLQAAGVSAWLLQRFSQSVQARINFHSSR